MSAQSIVCSTPHVQPALPARRYGDRGSPTPASAITLLTSLAVLFQRIGIITGFTRRRTLLPSTRHAA
jgi:hypothetical protein